MNNLITSTPVTFGKYKGSTLHSIAQTDANYIQFVSTRNFRTDEKQKFSFMNERFPEFVAAAGYMLDNFHKYQPKLPSCSSDVLLPEITNDQTKSCLLQAPQSENTQDETKSDKFLLDPMELDDLAYKSPVMSSSGLGGNNTSKVAIEGVDVKSNQVCKRYGSLRQTVQDLWPEITPNGHYFAKVRDIVETGKVIDNMVLRYANAEDVSPTDHDAGRPSPSKKARGGGPPSDVTSTWKRCLEIAGKVGEALGPNHSEATYENAMVNALYDSRIPYKRQVQYTQTVNGHIIQTGILDIEVDHYVLLELKANHEKIKDEHKAQLMRYLRCKRENMSKDKQDQTIIAGVINFSKSGETQWWQA